MDIALITEGTYPYVQGGVSVWCDQLVRGLAPHRFRVYGLTATGAEPVAWDLPDNVIEVNAIPLWGPPVDVPRSLLNSRVLHQTFELLTTSMAEVDGEANFLDALHQLYELSRETSLSGALRSKGCLRILLDAMSEVAVSNRTVAAASGPATVSDALYALQLIEHQLRALFAPAPEGDLCHATSNGLAVLTALSARWARGTPFVMSEHGIYLRERYLSYGTGNFSHPVRSMMLRFFRLLTWAGYQTADLITPVCEYNGRWAEISGAAPERIRPIYNGVDATRFPVAEAEPDVPTLSWVGRIDPLKDVETLLRAFAMVREAIPTARLRIFGSTPIGNEQYRDHCERMRTDLGLDGAAVFEGHIAPVVAAYHAGHVVVMTSISEGFPYTLIESMAAGRPPVATDVGGVREAAGEAGLIVPPKNAEAIAEASVRLLSDDELRNSIGEAARARILSLFTVERCTARFEAVYRELVDTTWWTRPQTLAPLRSTAPLTKIAPDFADAV